jgi:asparagine synthase (glutamine-hydrolysing)
MAGDAEGLLVLAGRMATTLGHRGPDDSGKYAEPRVGLGLGHRRLAVLDLSPAGAQPMRSPDGRYVLVHNGEIYNFRELRAELEKAGGEFLPWRSDSDTEVILAAVTAWGIRQTLTRLIGMFAFALWDCQENTLYLARDRMGEKPLYYGRAGKALLFASELKAVRAFPGFEARLDMEALSQYLRFQYVPEPRSIYEGVSKLMPGHLLALTPDMAHLPEPEPYWTLSRAVERAQEEPFTGNPVSAATQLDTLLRSVVKNQMLSDVPLGCLLSGGIDSSLVTALMQAEADRQVKSFTIGYEETAYDESGQARGVAEHLGTEHTELIATPDHALDLIEHLPDIYDEPFADASQLPTLLVSRLTREHVTVCLTGDGGDEVFAGYNRHFWVPALWERIRILPQGVRAVAAETARIVPPHMYDALFRSLHDLLPSAAQVTTPGHKVHKLADVLSATSPEDLYKRLCTTWPRPDRLLPGTTEPPSPLDLPDSWPLQSEITRWMQYLDATTYLPGDILHKVDRATMSVALESRAPFLDHRVIEFAWRLPVDMLVQGRQGKRILRDILGRYVPGHLIDRPKAGFGVPLDQWLRGPLKDWATDLLSNDRLDAQGLFNSTMVDGQLCAHLRGTKDNQYRLWNMLMFQAWYDRWM